MYSFSVYIGDIVSFWVVYIDPIPLKSGTEVS